MTNLNATIMTAASARLSDSQDSLSSEELRPMGALPLPADAEVRIAGAVREILEALGENPEREGLLDTPQRVAKMYLEVFSGLHQDPRDHLKTQFSADRHHGAVIVKDIRFHSMCEHHLLPVYGKAHVAYLPAGGRLTGLSKIARLVEGFARRPQLQERLTDQIAQGMEDVLAPEAVLVVIEAEHMCMSMRGVRSPGSTTVTSIARGTWLRDSAARMEIMSLLRG
ncbi:MULTISPECIES: GTP cyclohydrolase I FolE [Gluconobacter]|uniref:GTP cyclohydrolase 1 n=6 Tax=Gluconobacter TaxID=441 RepID=A0A829WPN5_GLUOY|nr:MULTISPECIES: GTP cyclohydrolase I FolE [Gluconobacter]AHK71543.1 GTP cyclohydrolase 1 [Gluconobacter oxydans DSM 3504]MBF0864203.1 GTP cyclohydrolase I FolE [Gluconobacter sp. R71656]MBF0867915.1 GTP cyclohydrolase I FolE [Gluconobacter sp. R75628]MBF0872840.1 GTP cyclohydrolase I FolE [Gluconobacter sp. R75629]MBF0882086.1 GTP cyclohydrolase I FolE [Gluconobacter potus]